MSDEEPCIEVVCPPLEEHTISPEAIERLRSKGIIKRLGGDEPAPFVHDRVAARFPAGTDPRLAIREALGVFMERTDGTNAIPWWQRARWWHGGPYGLNKPAGFGASRGLSIAGSLPVPIDVRMLLLPPSRTGVVSGLPTSDQDAVYVTTDRFEATIFALRHARPVLYEVTIQQEPLKNDTFQSESSFRAPQATIRRVESLSQREIDQAARSLL